MMFIEAKMANTLIDNFSSFGECISAYVYGTNAAQSFLTGSGQLG